MNRSFDEMIRQHCRPLKPVPTSEQPLLHKLDGVRAVMFDIYGTLLISASGDITTNQTAAKGRAFVESLASLGVHFEGNAEVGVQVLLNEIAQEHERAGQAGVEYPEVEIVEMWRRTVPQLANDSADAPSLDDLDLRRLALEYELRVNPVWPMPNARRCLAELARGLPLGVISNAQFLTIELCRRLLGGRRLLGEESRSFEFDEELQYYSYQFGRAKPGLFLYERAVEGLVRRGIRACEAVYVGNDLLNDIMPAKEVGFRTVLFAGDARSLRRRDNDPRIAGVTPDIVITDLLQLLQCIN